LLLGSRLLRALPRSALLLRPLASLHWSALRRSLLLSRTLCGRALLLRRLLSARRGCLRRRRLSTLHRSALLRARLLRTGPGCLRRRTLSGRGLLLGRSLRRLLLRT
jgi:hypothetical protein